MAVGIGYFLDLCEATRRYPSQAFLFFWIPASPCFIPQINQTLLWGFFVHSFFPFPPPPDFHNTFTIKKTLAICL